MSTMRKQIVAGFGSLVLIVVLSLTAVAQQGGGASSTQEHVKQKKRAESRQRSEALRIQMRKDFGQKTREYERL